MNKMIVRPEYATTRANIIQQLIDAGQVLEEQRVPTEDRYIMVPGFLTLTESQILRRFHNCINQAQYRKVRAQYEEWRKYRKAGQAALRSGRTGTQENFRIIKSDL